MRLMEIRSGSLDSLMVRTLVLSGRSANFTTHFVRDVPMHLQHPLQYWCREQDVVHSDCCTVLTCVVGQDIHNHKLRRLAILSELDLPAKVKTTYIGRLVETIEFLIRTLDSESPMCRFESRCRYGTPIYCKHPLLTGCYYCKKCKFLQAAL